MEPAECTTLLVDTATGSQGARTSTPGDGKGSSELQHKLETVEHNITNSAINPILGSKRIQIRGPVCYFV